MVNDNRNENLPQDTERVKKLFTTFRQRKSEEYRSFSHDQCVIFIRPVYFINVKIQLNLDLFEENFKNFRLSKLNSSTIVST